jgi:hypothetical protein
MMPLAGLCGRGEWMEEENELREWEKGGALSFYLSLSFSLSLSLSLSLALSLSLYLSI